MAGPAHIVNEAGQQPNVTSPQGKQEVNPLTTIGGEMDVQAAQAGSATALTPEQQLAATQATSLSQAAATAQRLGVTSGSGSTAVTGLGAGVGGTSSADAAALAELLDAQKQANAAQAEADNQSALLTIEQTLASYGFSGSSLQQLVNFAWSEIKNNVPAAQVALDIQNTPAFQQQFPAISERIAQGLPPITPAEYLSTLDSYTQTLVAAGIDPHSVDLNNLVAKDVSPSELNGRIQQGYVAIAMAPQDVINAFQNYYGVTKGQLVQYFTNPNANEAQLLQKAAAAQIGGAAAGSGFLGANQANGKMPIDQSLALQLAQQGVTYGQAQSGFATLATQAQLYSKLPGQGQVRSGPGGGSPYTASTNQLAEAQFFGGPEEQQLQQQAQREKNFFQAGTALGSSGQQTAAGALQR